MPCLPSPLRIGSLLATLAIAAGCKDKEWTYDVGDEDSGAASDGSDGASDENDVDGDGFSIFEGDCDDDDADINPDATEVCDGADNDCDGVTDEQDAADVTTWYFDGDGDGWGDEDASAVSCDQLTNHVERPGDCNDDVASANPDGVEVCDGYDNDCNGEVDDGDIETAPTWYYDGDDDGFGTPDTTVTGCDQPSDHVDNGDDCDDTNPAINPDATDGTSDGIDDDCDGTPDDEASCNAYRPFGYTSGVRTYTTFALDGSSYTETVTIQSWDAAAGVAVLQRSFSATTGSQQVQETHQCNGGAVQMTGWVHRDASGSATTFSYSSPRTDVEDESLLVVGARWTYSYTATDSLATLSWSASGTMEVEGFESVTVPAGTFDSMRVRNDYELIDSSGVVGSRTGTATSWWVLGLGPVKVVDTSDGGSTTNETRELSSYTGFAP